MAELLGNKFCVENLHKDVRDLHNVLNSVTSRIGQVSYTSWKFPDKLALDVNVPELLEMCEFDVEYDEENKISHLLLLELVIDRLLFFIQCSNRFTDQMFMSTRAQSAIDSHSSSIGVVTKKYWTKVFQLHSNNQQSHSDSKSQIRKIKELQSYNQELLDELSDYHQGVTHVPANSAKGRKALNGSFLPPISPSNTESSIAKDNSNKSSQTLETAFVPCESCHRVQSSFRSVADSMSNLCRVQGLPSAVAKYRKQLKGLDWYSANDIARWSVEQSKDLERINNHLSELMSTIDPLKEQLADTITSCRNLERRVTECQREVDSEKETLRVREQQHTHTVETIKKTHEDIKSDLETQRSQLQRSKQQLQQRLDETKRDLELQLSKYQELEDVKKQLIVELEESQTNNAEVKRLESILSSLEKEMRSAKEQQLEAESQLSQEEAITKSLTKRTESLQSKYDSLVRRIDEMDDENTTLQSELSTLLDEKERLEHSLAESWKNKQSQSVVDKIESEKEELRGSIDTLQQAVTTLEQQLKSMKERERLMVEYPDLNGPVNADVTGTGDIFTDMSNQVAANQLRIELLDKQNSMLKKTLSKLGGQQKQQQPRSRPFEREEDSRPQYNSVSPMEPTTLWNQSSSFGDVAETSQPYRNARPHTGQMGSNLNSQSNKHTGARASAAGDFVVGSSPESGKSKQPQSNSGMDAYMKLKKAGLLKPSGKSSKNEQGGGGLGTSGSYCCPNCDKLYTSLADLDIHRSYCARR